MSGRICAFSKLAPNYLKATTFTHSLFVHHPAEAGTHTRNVALEPPGSRVWVPAFAHKRSGNTGTLYLFADRFSAGLPAGSGTQRLGIAPLYFAVPELWLHLIENFFCKLKEFKRIAMRADKTDRSFEAAFYLAGAVINFKCISTDPRQDYENMV